MTLLHRRRLLAVGLAGAVPACARPATADPRILIVGDQRGGQKVVLEATGGLRDLPYAIQWASFPNAAPVMEALNAGAIAAPRGSRGGVVRSLRASLLGDLGFPTDSGVYADLVGRQP